jgi:hypothetical protein
LERPKVPKVSNVQVGHLREVYLDADGEERAAILEYDAGFTRAEADAQAAEEFPELPDFLRRVREHAINSREANIAPEAPHAGLEVSDVQ